MFEVGYWEVVFGLVDDFVGNYFVCGIFEYLFVVVVEFEVGGNVC